VPDLPVADDHAGNPFLAGGGRLPRRITKPLAAAGMGVNPVSAFYHDQLFVPADRAEEAVQIL